MVRVEYTCNGCHIHRSVEVRDRRPGEDLGAWMRVMQLTVGFHHRHEAPDCMCETCDLKLPLSTKDDARVGDAAG